MECKRPAGAYPLRDFHKSCRVSTAFQVALGVKISLDLLKELRCYGDFKLRCLVIHTFSAPPSGETMGQITKRFRCAGTYLIYSEANSKVLRPAGETRCTDGGL